MGSCRTVITRHSIGNAAIQRIWLFLRLCLVMWWHLFSSCLLALHHPRNFYCIFSHTNLRIASSMTASSWARQHDERSDDRRTPLVNDESLIRPCGEVEQVCSTCVSFRFFAVFVLLRETGVCGKIGLLLRPLFPPLDATCPARAWWAQRGHGDFRMVGVACAIFRAVRLIC